MNYRRFGRTELQVPVISCGGMRYQHSWASDDAISDESQRTVEACVRKAFDLGINHFETARGYGTSEEQLGRILPKLPRDEIIVQTKVGPMPDIEKFKATFEKSMSLIKMDYIDLFALHGINNQETLDYALDCLEVVQQWKESGRIRAIGFSTHGATDIIVKAVQTNHFDYMNLHWYYIFQDNWPAIEEAAKRDVGVFIISPNDKGGKLYEPSEKLCELTSPYHPMVFNGLYCLSKPEVHTLSCGVSTADDFDIHMETVKHLDRVDEILPPILQRLEQEMEECLGEEWARTWQEGVPEWPDTPGEINMPWILRLRNLAVAYDMIEYGRMRYNMLGKGGHWFPGNKADALDGIDLSDCLSGSPNADAIPGVLREAHEMLAGAAGKRLQEDD